MTDIVDRVAARVVVVDPAGRVLLMQGHDPDHPAEKYWFTPGGGLEPGETAQEAAARELLEETGLRVTAADLGEPVFADRDEFTIEGRRYRQDQQFFAVRTAAFTAAPVKLEEAEARSVLRLAWLSVDELATLGDPYYPPELPRLVGLAISRSA